VNGDLSKDHRINNIPPDILKPFPSNFINRELTREGMKMADMAALVNNKKDLYTTTTLACCLCYLF